MNKMTSLRLLATAFVLPWCSGELNAQCGLYWEPGQTAGSPDGSVYGLTRLSNGDLIAVGTFRIADGEYSRGVARYDGASWHGLGGGLFGSASVALELPNGDLVVGGHFTEAGGLPVANIARWDGSQWHAMGAGLEFGSVYALLLTSSGDLIAGGSFSVSGAASVNHVARWNGVSWLPMVGAVGSTVPGERVSVLAELPNGDILAGGDFDTVNGGPANALARYSGASWSAIPGLAGASSYVSDIEVLPSGDYYLAGRFQVTISAPQVNLARMSNGFVQYVPNPVQGDIYELAFDGAGDLFAAGGFFLDPGVDNVASFNGTSWTLQGPGLRGLVTALERDANGRIVAGSYEDGSPLGAEPMVRRFDGTTWGGLGDPFPGLVRALAVSGSDLYAGGDFLRIHGIAANRIARNRGGAWSPLGVGVDDEVTCAAADPAGQVVFGGEFLHAGGAPAAHVARWTGSAWVTLGAGLPAAPRDIAAGSGGEVVAIVGTDVFHFDGLNWSGVIATQAAAVVADPQGGFVIGGNLFGGSARLQGGQLTGLIGGTSFRALTIGRGGSVLGRGFADPSTFRLDGSFWTSTAAPPLSGFPDAFVQLPNGDLVVAAAFGEIWRSRNSGWDPVDRGVADPVSNNTIVNDMVVRDGELFVAGDFRTAGEQVSIGLAKAVSDCPASVAVVGAGCTGGAGPVTLATDDLPWLGSSMTMTADGMTPLSVGIHAVGTAATFTPLPFGASGCALLVQPIYYGTLTTQAGEAEASLTLPANPVLLAQEIRSQVVGIELDPSLAIQRTTASNALLLTVGSF